MSETLAETPANDAAPETKVEDAPAESSPAPVKVDPVQKRFDKLTWKNHELQRQIDELRVKPESKPEASETLTRPTKADFNFDEDAYEAAMDDYRDKRAEQIADRKLEEKLTKREQETKAKANEQSFERRQSDFEKEHPDYREKVLENDALPISNAMAKILRKSEMGPAVAYYLNDNLEKAEEISKLSDVEDVAREIGRIEALLEKPAKANALPAEQKASKAPPPVPKIEASDPVIEKDPSQMTDFEFRKWREKSISQRRRR